MHFGSTLYWACRIPTSHKRSRSNLGVPCPCPDTSRRGNNCVAPTMWGVWRWLHGSQIWRHEGIGISPSQCELTRNELWHTSSFQLSSMITKWYRLTLNESHMIRELFNLWLLYHVGMVRMDFFFLYFPYVLYILQFTVFIGVVLA